MKKYPVISSNGVEYAVEIFQGETIVYFGLNIYIYKVINKSILGFKYKSYKKLKSYNVKPTEVDYQIYKYNYVEFVKEAIIKYEKSIEIEFEYKIKKDKNINDFKNWNGQC